MRKKTQVVTDKIEMFGINKILDLVSDAVFYSEIARKVGISEGTLLSRLRSDYADLYARANENRSHRIAEDILRISDDDTRDRYYDADGNARSDAAVIQRDRLRVDSRKWLASKMLPKQYGDKQDLNVSGTLDLSTAIIAARKRTGG